MKLTVSNLSKTYGSVEKQVKALNSVSFTANSGDIVGILGPNGAGKSTLNKILSTSLIRTAGEVFLDDISIDQQKIYRKNISSILQSTSLEFWLSVEENLKIYGKFYGLKGAELKKRVNESIELFELGDFKNKRVTELSGGFRKRVQLAKTFMVNSSLIILDEPTVGLDPFAKRKMMDLLKQKAKEGALILFTTQNISEAEDLCNYLIFINKGEIIAKGHKQEIQKKFKINNKLMLEFMNLDEMIVSEIEAICFKYNIDKPLWKDNSLYLSYEDEEIIYNKILLEILSRFKPKNINILQPSLEDVFINILE